MLRIRPFGILIHLEAQITPTWSLPWFSSDVNYELNTPEHEREYRETYFGIGPFQFRMLTP